MGGVKNMVLTHQDDVADHKHWAKALNCDKWIHARDSNAAPEAEQQLIGNKVITLGKSLKLIPTPGHTLDR